MGQPSPGSHPPSRRLELPIVQGILVGLALLIVGLRLITRYFVVKCPGWDDHAIVLATMTAIAETGVTLSATRHGIGLHHQSPRDISYTLKLFYFARILYALTITSIKISILLLYLRLFPGQRIRRSVKAVMALTLTGSAALLLLWVFMCHPIPHTWEPSSSGSCINRSKVFQAAAIFSLLVNVIIIALPMPVIRGLQLSLGRRLVIFGIFALGFVPCGALVARLLLPLTAATFDSDPTWWMVDTEEMVSATPLTVFFTFSLTVSRVAEYATGLICASLIHLKPLFIRLLPHVFDNNPRSIRISKLWTHDAPPNVRHALSRMDDRKYGYGSPGRVSTRTRQTTFLDGPHDCRSEDTPEPPDTPCQPEKVYSWSPRVCHQQEAPLLRHASPV